MSVWRLKLLLAWSQGCRPTDDRRVSVVHSVKPSSYTSYSINRINSISLFTGVQRSWAVDSRWLTVAEWTCHIAWHTGWLKKSKLLTQYNSLLFLSHPVYSTSGCGLSLLLTVCVFVFRISWHNALIHSYSVLVSNTHDLWQTCSQGGQRGPCSLPLNPSAPRLSEKKYCISDTVKR